MRKLLALLIGIALGAGLMYGAFHYHVVRTSEEFLFVSKRQVSLSQAYVDVRGWTFAEWQAHPELIQALVEHGRSELIVPPPAPPREPYRPLFPRFGTVENDSQPRRE